MLEFKDSPEPDEFVREKGRKLFSGNVDFLKGVVDMNGLPPADRLEVCFAGRSNVGKSSLINAITGRKSIARASNTPGRTQEINYFKIIDLNNDDFVSIDEMNQSIDIIFQLIDKNKDNKISLSELEELKEIIEMLK